MIDLRSCEKKLDSPVRPGNDGSRQADPKTLDNIEQEIEIRAVVLRLF